MWQYVVAGLVLGGIYAISAAGLVVTYLSAGILNFAFGALAFFIARFFYFLRVQQHWSIPAAGVVALLLVGPALGISLYLLLFRFLRLSSTLIKVVVTLGLSVTIPPLASLAFGNQTILSAPGLAPEPVRVFHFIGVPVTLDQIIVYVCVIVVLIAGGWIIRYTDIGLQVRAMVDSPAMTSLTGTSPTTVSVGVWAASTFLAGMAGVLSAPIIGLSSGDYTLLMASAFAAVIAARLRSVPTAVVVGLLMGVAGSLVPHYLPPSSSLTAAIIPSIPFIVTAVFLIFHILRGGYLDEAAGVGGALDRAVSTQQEVVRPRNRQLGWAPAAVGLAAIAVLPVILHGLWIGLVAGGICYGVLFLSFSLVVGDGGMVWLCIATLAGVGGLLTGQLAGKHGWPVLLAVFLGGLVAAPMGVVIGALTIRLGEMYVALVTLTFGLLMENLVFTRDMFANGGSGVFLNPPQFAQSQRVLAYLAMAIFLVVALFIVNLRRSTMGLALTAVRASEPAAKTIGLSVLQSKLTVAALASFVAGVGGALLAVQQGLANSSNYATLAGVLWLAVLVTQGVRSIVAALIAGLTLTISSGLALEFFPPWFGQLPPILFGLGAIALAKNPDGLLAMQARQIRSIAARLALRKPIVESTAAEDPPVHLGVP